MNMGAWTYAKDRIETTCLEKLVGRAGRASAVCGPAAVSSRRRRGMPVSIIRS